MAKKTRVRAYVKPSKGTVVSEHSRSVKGKDKDLTIKLDRNTKYQMQLSSIAGEVGLPYDEVHDFVMFMTKAFPKEFDEGYMMTWARRFLNGREYAQSDNERRKVLLEVNPTRYKPVAADKSKPWAYRAGQRIIWDSKTGVWRDQATGKQHGKIGVIRQVKSDGSMVVLNEDTQSYEDVKRSQVYDYAAYGGLRPN